MNNNDCWCRKFTLESCKHKTYINYIETPIPEILKNIHDFKEGYIVYKEQFETIENMLPYIKFWETLHNKAIKLLRKEKLKAIEND
jgi:hypothetical protein